MSADERHLRLALAVAADARLVAPPNPWVGCAIVANGTVVGLGATAAPGGPHAEVTALEMAGERARGATAYVTLETCAHHGRTPPCTDALIAAGVARVVVGIPDPDERVAGRGIELLRSAGIDVRVGVLADEVSEQLQPYLTHRRTGRPYVVLKLAATLDGRIGAADQSSTWVTGTAARADVHRLRAESDAILVGAGTIRADDPRLDVRDFRPAFALDDSVVLHPRRVVLGSIPDDARVRPATEFRGELVDLLGQLGADGVLQLLVEGGANVAGRFHRAGLVDRYVLYIAPALLGGDNGVPMFSGAGAETMADAMRGRFVSVDRLGDDLRLVFEPRT